MTASPAPRRVHRLAAAAWLLVSLAALASLARGGYAIGIDFEGGALLSFAPLADDGRCDARQIDAAMRARHPALEYELRSRSTGCELNFRGLTDGPTLDAVARTVLTEHATPLAVDARHVVEPSYAPVLGRPTALALGATATLLWCATLVLPARALAVAGAALTALTVGLTWILGLGGTLGRASYLAALWFAPALATLTATSGRPRLRRSLVGVFLLAGLIAAATAGQGIDVGTSSELLSVRAAARLALTHVVLAVALAPLAIWTVRAE